MSIISHSSGTSTLKRLDGEVAVITGGASGIGESTARLFVKHGAKVVIADVQDDLGHSLCDELSSEGNLSYVHCDVTSDSDVQNTVDFAVSKYGKLDIMYCNAGISGSKETGILNSDIGNFKKVLDVNIVGSFLGAKHAARVMIPANKGCILFTSSVVSVTAGFGDGIPHPYVASKHAIVGLTKNLCVELGQYGIRVNCISPHGVATPLLRRAVPMLDKEKVEELISKAGNLKGEVLEAEDIANAALYLGSQDAKYISGMNLVVDGGYSAGSSKVGQTIRSYLTSTSDQ